jgi:hypothetical protein
VNAERRSCAPLLAEARLPDLVRVPGRALVRLDRAHRGVVQAPVAAGDRDPVVGREVPVLRRRSGRARLHHHLPVVVRARAGVEAATSRLMSAYLELWEWRKNAQGAVIAGELDPRGVVARLGVDPFKVRPWVVARHDHQGLTVCGDVHSEALHVHMSIQANAPCRWYQPGSASVRQRRQGPRRG